MVADCGSSLWNEDRKALGGLIEELNPTLAGMYHRAILLMSEPPGPGEERARLALVGHCFRELMNRLPDTLQDVDGFPASKRQEEERVRDDLVAAYEAFLGKPLDQPAPGTSGNPEQPTLVSVPKDLLDTLGKFVAAREEGTRNVRERDAVAVLGAIDPLDPALKPWQAARKFFMSCTHIDLQYGVETKEKTPPSDEAVMGHIEAVEASIRVRLGAFFDIYEELEDLIAKANERVDEGASS